MYRASTYVLATVVCVATTAMLATSRSAIHSSSTSVNAQLESDGAFRDGLYLGKLAAESGLPMSPEVGRWSTNQDRATFSTGYQRGYNEARARLQP
jgi:hypothetical protein